MSGKSAVCFSPATSSSSKANMRYISLILLGKCSGRKRGRGLRMCKRVLLVMGHGFKSRKESKNLIE